MSEEKKSALDISKELLDSYNIFVPKSNMIVKELSAIIESNMSPHMAQGMAVFAMSTFANHMRYKIEFGENNLVPINAIIFILSHSGSGKTSSERMLRKAFGAGYTELEIDFNKDAIEYARRMEINADKLPRLPFFNKIGTGPGFIKRINEFEKRTIGTPSLIIDEIANELESNSDTSENIQIIAELFDSGELEDKPLKDSTNQASPIYNMGITSLIMGSEASMFDGSDALKLFYKEFITKLGRRCFFIYPVHIPKDNQYTKQSLIDELHEEDSIPYQKIKKMSKFSKDLIEYRRANLDDNGIVKPLKLDDDARSVYLYYKRYCFELSESKYGSKVMTKEDEIIYLELANRHWKALKLAGVFTVFRGSSEINIDDLREAISFAENMNGYLHNFMNKASELVHEKLASYIRENMVMPTSHELKKMKLISKNMEIPDLCESANTLISDIGAVNVSGNTFIFIPKDDGLIGYSVKSTGLNQEYVGKVKTQLATILSKISDNDIREKIIAKYNLDADADDITIEQKLYKEAGKVIKTERAKMVSGGNFNYVRTKFENMVEMLQSDNSFSAFEYKENIRSDENCIGKTNLLILDIDDSDETMQEVSNAMQELNHIAVSSSDKNNPYKFRLIVKLNSEIELNKMMYQKVIESFGSEYGLIIDKLSRAQLYHAYIDSKVIVNIDQEDFDVLPLMNKAEKQLKEIRTVNVKDKNELWIYRDNYFQKWFRLSDTKGTNHHNKIVGLFYYSRDLGASKGLIIALLEEYHEQYDTRRSHLDKLIVRIMNDNDIPN